MAKELKDLTFKDNYLFQALMLDAENCRLVLERILERPIEKVVPNTEYSILFNPDYKGVRLDVLAKGENEYFNVEMQVEGKELFRRARYYHSSMDMSFLGTGKEYKFLPDSYVIFICDFDPLGYGKYKYTGVTVIKELPEYNYNDGAQTIFLNTRGHEETGVSKELVEFLRFAGADLANMEIPSQDKLIGRLQRNIKSIKSDRKMVHRYMTFEELQEDNYRKGKAEGKAEGKADAVALVVSARFNCPEKLRERIMSLRDTKILEQLLAEALDAENFADFEAKISKLI